MHLVSFHKGPFEVCWPNMGVPGGAPFFCEVVITQHWWEPRHTCGLAHSHSGTHVDSWKEPSPVFYDFFFLVWPSDHTQPSEFHDGDLQVPARPAEALEVNPFPTSKLAGSCSCRVLNGMGRVHSTASCAPEGPSLLQASSIGQKMRLGWLRSGPATVVFFGDVTVLSALDFQMPQWVQAQATQLESAGSVR